MSCIHCHQVSKDGECCTKSRSDKKKPLGKYKDAIKDILDIIEYSEGVTGYHRNGDIFHWDECEDIIELLQEAVS